MREKKNNAKQSYLTASWVLFTEINLFTIWITDMQDTIQKSNKSIKNIKKFTFINTLSAQNINNG